MNLAEAMWFEWLLWGFLLVSRIACLSLTFMNYHNDSAVSLESGTLLSLIFLQLFVIFISMVPNKYFSARKYEFERLNNRYGPSLPHRGVWKLWVSTLVVGVQFACTACGIFLREITKNQRLRTDVLLGVLIVVNFLHSCEIYYGFLWTVLSSEEIRASLAPAHQTIYKTGNCPQRP